MAHVRHVGVRAGGCAVASAIPAARWPGGYGVGLTSDKDRLTSQSTRRPVTTAHTAHANAPSYVMWATGSNSLRARGVSWYVADAGSAGCRESYGGRVKSYCLIVLLSLGSGAAYLAD